MPRSKFNFLIVEDEIISLEYLKHILLSLGYKNIYEATNASDAYYITRKKAIDLVFMDININDTMNGISCAFKINENLLTPIPMLYTTAYGDSDTILDASKTNIFGFLIKPFESQDVEAALTVALKNKLKHLADTTKYKKDICPIVKNYSFNIKTQTLYIDNTPIDLTKKEFTLLAVLCENINHNVPYDLLYEFVWSNKEVSISTLRDTILRLRKKAPLLNIESVSGYGYILKEIK